MAMLIPGLLLSVTFGITLQDHLMFVYWITVVSTINRTPNGSWGVQSKSTITVKKQHGTTYIRKFVLLSGWWFPAPAVIPSVSRASHSFLWIYGYSCRLRLNAAAAVRSPAAIHRGIYRGIRRGQRLAISTTYLAAFGVAAANEINSFIVRGIHSAAVTRGRGNGDSCRR